MQQLKQLFNYKSLNNFFVVLFLISMLVSCSKVTDLQPEPKAGLNAIPLTVKSNGNSLVSVPFEETVFVPCANGGAGENVFIKGKTNFVYQAVWNDNGFYMVYHSNIHEVTGSGLISGDRFVASGGTNGTVYGSWVNGSFIANTVQQLRLVSNNSSFFVNDNYRITATANGTVSVQHDGQTSECR